MLFRVLSPTEKPIATSEPLAYLVEDRWNDFGYQTMYRLVISDGSGSLHDIGDVKIGQFEWQGGQIRPAIDQSFDSLDDRFFSVGQDDSYYVRLNALGADWRDSVLSSLHDIGSDRNLCNRALTEKVCIISLLRMISVKTLVGQFRRLASGLDRLTAYNFTYTAPQLDLNLSRPVELTFDVTPDSTPPTNVHILVGSNGVGKTHLLKWMVNAVVLAEAEREKVGYFTSTPSEGAGAFAGLVSVSFSAFDTFDSSSHSPLEQDPLYSGKVRYEHVGLSAFNSAFGNSGRITRTPDHLTEYFVLTMKECQSESRITRLLRAFEFLNADPIFRDARVDELATALQPRNDGLNSAWEQRCRQTFRSLSSGHKVVLLSIACLVKAVEESTLVLMDEPETHLHPPLLSAYIRALSDLLMERNGVAIIATHSPVVLQEVPRRCVWKIRRSGGIQTACRPEIETFGENVGVLTREVFQLEVTHSGFHTFLQRAVDENSSLAEVLHEFNGELGGEARAILRSLVDLRDSSRSE